VSALAQAPLGLRKRDELIVRLFSGPRRGDCLDKKHLRKTLAGCAPGYEINVHGA
jgi:hypothetical protein